MPSLLIDDADRETIIAPHDAQHVGWGRRRVYGPDTYPHVEKYLEALVSAAREARGVYLARREEARVAFKAQFPSGVLPDEADEHEDKPRARFAHTGPRHGKDQHSELPLEEPAPRGASGSVDDPR